jgi:hypothetical protein
VNLRKGALTVLVATTLTSVTMPLAAQAPASDISSAKDLTAVIALQGLPCGQVTDAKQRGDNDYLATCQDGHRYHVYVNAQGRVVVEKQ